MARCTPGATSPPPAGSLPTSIARWDGSEWHPLGSGMDGGIPQETRWRSAQMARFTPGGSSKSPAELQPAKSPAGMAPSGIPWAAGWQEDGLPSVRALAVGPDGSLYAGGAFTTAGGVGSQRHRPLGRRTSSWHPLGSGIGLLRVSAPWRLGRMARSTQGAAFTTAGGVAANYIARWDGDWMALPSLGSGMSGAVSVPLRWDRMARSTLGASSPQPAGLQPTASLAGTALQWHPLGSGMGGVYYRVIYALAFSPDGSLYAGGSFTTAGGIDSQRHRPLGPCPLPCHR